MRGYIYKTTHNPTGSMYFGSRKLKEGVTPETDSYRGSPADTNLMYKLFETRPDEEFSKEILFEGDYEEVLELENLTIEEAWDKWGKVSEGGLVTNLVAKWGRAIVVTDETRAKISASNQGKTLSAETRAKIGASNKVKNLGVPLSEEHKAKIGASHTGGSNGHAKAVINTATGQVWPTVNEAAESEGVGATAISNRIRLGLKGGIWKYA